MKTTVSSKHPQDLRKTILYITVATIGLALIITVAVLSRNPSIVPQSATETHAQSALKVGQIAPAFAVSTTAGSFDLASAKTPVLLEVFATWCPHCQRETKVIDKLYAKFGKEVTIVGVTGSAVSMDGTTPASENDLIQFAQKYQATYPLAFDSELKVAGAYLQAGFPTLILIKADKTIAYIGDGEVTEQILAAAIKKTL